MPDLLIRNIARDIDRNIRNSIVDEGKRKFVIYTNGMGGKFVKEYLASEFGISPEYIIDNKVFNGKDVLNIEQAKKRDNENVYFLISSWHNDYYEQIREVIYGAFPKEQIIDVFPRVKPKVLPTDEEICSVLRDIDAYVKGMENINCG